MIIEQIKDDLDESHNTIDGLINRIEDLRKQALKLLGFSNMKTLNDITFGLPVTTAYSNGKITATLLHGNETKTRKRVSYNHSLNTGENHYAACLAVLEKVKAEEGKDFEVISYTYSEKGTGYTFTCHRTN